MKIYKVLFQNQELNFIAEDKDHVITLLSQLLNTTNYFSLMRDIRIEQVAGPVTEDSVKFYVGL